MCNDLSVTAEAESILYGGHRSRRYRKHVKYIAPSVESDRRKSRIKKMKKRRLSYALVWQSCPADGLLTPQCILPGPYT